MTETTTVDTLRAHLTSGEPLDLQGAYIAGTDLRAALLEPPEPADPRGLCIVGATVTGRLDLNGAALTVPLGLINCTLLDGIRAMDASLRSLQLSYSTLGDPGRVHKDTSDRPILNLDGARIDGSAANLTATGEVRAPDTPIAGKLNLTGATLTNPNGDSLYLDQAHIDGGLVAANLTATGEVRARGTHIAGQLNLTGATLTNPNGDSLNLEQTHIDGSLVAANLTATGEVRALGAHITGQALLGGSLRGDLNLQEARIGALILGDFHVAVEATDLTDTQVGSLAGPSNGPPLTGPVTGPGLRVTRLYGAIGTDSAVLRGWLETFVATVSGSTRIRGTHSPRCSPIMATLQGQPCCGTTRHAAPPHRARAG